MSGEAVEERPEGCLVGEIRGLTGLQLIRSCEDGGAGVELLLDHSFAEDFHAVLVGGRVEDFVRGEVR